MSAFAIEPYDSLVALRDWFVNQVLPVWLSTTNSADSGHFHEGLDLNAKPLADKKVRVRTAARMIYVYSEAARHGVGPTSGLVTAIRAADALERDARILDGGYVRAIDRDTGIVLDPVMDLYDQSCVLLALASLLAATGDRAYRERADSLLCALDNKLGASDGGWAEDENGSLPRRQNPHMHMFEALIALTDATGDRQHRERLEALAALMRDRFLDGQAILREFFGPDWNLGSEWRSERVEPGHMAEWAWLIHSAGQVTDQRNRELTRALLANALELGQASDDPRFLVDQVSTKGVVLSNGRRLWPQAELIKACLAAGDLDRAAQTAGALLETYLADTPAGTWRDRFDLDGRPVAEMIPASSCYHLWTAVVPLLQHPGIR